MKHWYAADTDNSGDFEIALLDNDKEAFKWACNAMKSYERFHGGKQFYVWRLALSSSVNETNAIEDFTQQRSARREIARG